MARLVRTDRYFYIYDNDQGDMVWYSPSTDDQRKCRKNLLNCIEETRRILRRNPHADVQIYEHVWDMCGEYEDGDECDVLVANPNDLDGLEDKLRKEERA